MFSLIIQHFIVCLNNTGFAQSWFPDYCCLGQGENSQRGIILVTNIFKNTCFRLRWGIRDAPSLGHIKYAVLLCEPDLMCSHDAFPETHKDHSPLSREQCAELFNVLLHLKEDNLPSPVTGATILG